MIDLAADLPHVKLGEGDGQTHPYQDSEEACDGPDAERLCHVEWVALTDFDSELIGDRSDVRADSFRRLNTSHVEAIGRIWAEEAVVEEKARKDGHQYQEYYHERRSQHVVESRAGKLRLLLFGLRVNGGHFFSKTRN